MKILKGDKMNKKIDDVFYKKILQEFEYGKYTYGDDCMLKLLSNIFDNDSTPQYYSTLLNYNKCSLKDVPKSVRTKDFYITNFNNEEVFEYIKENINFFDRKFFKDLLTSNNLATTFENNAFAVMPYEYIDEEMCALAIINATNWSSDEWLYTVYDRKPDALNENIWKLGARLYARLSNGNNHFLQVTPEKYKDEEYFLQMCKCNYNYGNLLLSNKGKIMQSVPQKYLNAQFLLKLLEDNVKNIANFSEKGLETIITYEKDNKEVKEKIWQYILKIFPYSIRHIDLNDERVNYFLHLYKINSLEYIYFADIYEMYLREKNAQVRSKECKLFR